MGYLLGLVMEKDMVKGNFSPSYILSFRETYNEHRSCFVLSRTGGRWNYKPLVLPNMRQYDDLVDFCSKFRTRDHRYYMKRRGKRIGEYYYPKGCLCWFVCTIQGRIIGPAVYIRHVPMMNIRQDSDTGFQSIKDQADIRLSWKELMTRDLNGMILNTVRKPIFQRVTHKNRGPEQMIFAEKDKKPKKQAQWKIAGDTIQLPHFWDRRTLRSEYYHDMPE